MAYAIIELFDGIRHSYIPINVSAGETFEAHIQSNVQHEKIHLVNLGKPKKSCRKHLTQTSGYNRISEVSI